MIFYVCLWRFDIFIKSNLYLFPFPCWSTWPPLPEMNFSHVNLELMRIWLLNCRTVLLYFGMLYRILKKIRLGCWCWEYIWRLPVDVDLFIQIRLQLIGMVSLAVLHRLTYWNSFVGSPLIVGHCFLCSRIFVWLWWAAFQNNAIGTTGLID